MAPRRSGRVANRYRHLLNDQSSWWCLGAGRRGFTKGAHAGGRLVFFVGLCQITTQRRGLAGSDRHLGPIAEVRVVQIVA